MQETKIPLYLNKDDAPEKLTQVEAFDLHNTRPTGTANSEEGYLTNIESTELITDLDDLPSGINITLGAEAFKNVKKAYSLKYNSTGKHRIFELDYETLVETVIFTDLDDTGGVQLFNLSPNHEFNDLKLLHDEYLITADGQSGVIYCINIERLKSGGYGSVITQDSFNLLKAQPLKPIKAEYVDAPAKKSNLLKGKLFQFRAERGLADYMKSAWSTISKRPIPETESTDSVGDDPTKLNAIKLSVDIGDELTLTLRIAARSGLYDWSVIKEVTREYVLSLQNTDIEPLDEVYEAYDPTTNIYTFLFFNEGQGEPIAVSNTDEAYDNVPQNVGAIEIVNGDIIVLGDIEEGYDRPTNTTVDLSVTAYKAQLDISLEEEERDFQAASGNAVIQVLIGQQHRRYATLFFSGTPKEGDIISINLGDIRSSSTTQTLTYTVTAPQNGNLSAVLDSIYNLVPSSTHGGKVKVKNMTGSNSGEVKFVTANYQEVKSVVLDLSITGSALVGKSVNILKSNTSYQVALAHYDKFGRQFPIVTNTNDYTVGTSSYAETEGLTPQIAISLDGTPPEGAVSYQWLLSENTKYISNLFVTGVYDEVESKDDFIVFNLASLGRYERGGSESILAYEYSEGDRLTLIHTFLGSSTPIKWFNNPPIDLAVFDFEIKAETVLDVTTVKYLLKVKKSSLINLVDLEAKEILFELYTPKRNNADLNTVVFYEIGEQYDIVDGDYSVKNTIIRTGDAYLRPRKYVSNIEGESEVYGFAVEDFNFSDDYDSKFWSAGRGRTYNDEVGKVQRKASFRYSGEYNIGSLINEINRFYATRIYGDQPEETSSIYGAITKMVMRQQYLIVLQETDVAHIPVFSSIIEDQVEQANLAISTKLFNNARYVGNGLGTGLAKKAISVSNNGTVYFIDPNNGYPCRDGFDGVKVINVKMNKFFIEKLKGVDPKTLIGTYDDFNKEWNISFTGLYGEVNVIPFTAENWEYLDDYNLTAEDVTIVEPEHGTATIDVDGNILYTPDEGYFGTDTVGIVFVSESVVINKNACITIQAGINTVDDFSFTPLFNQEIETVLESNINFVQGSTIAVAISIVDGEYRILIDDVWGAWTSTAGTINPEEGFQVRRESADDYEELVSTTLTIADKSATFEITTRPEVFDVPNDLRSGTATRNNCTGGQIGSLVTYTVPAGTYFAADKAAANALAEADVLANKQAYANSTGTCTAPPSVGNDYQAITYYKVCPEGQTGSAHIEFRNANTYFSTTKPLANALAVANIMSVGQTNANATGTCSVPSTFTVQLAIYSDYSNASYLTSDVRGASVEFYNNIGGLVTAKLVTTNVTRNSTVYSFAVPFSGTPFSLGYVRLLPRYAATTVSTTDTETLYVNGVLQGNYTHAVASGIGSGFGYSINLAPAGSVTLNTSDVVLITHGTPPPETVYYSAPYSASIARNNCPSGETPVGTVTLLANYGDFTSTADQITANNLAIAYVEANKQANANLYGTCEIVPPACDLLLTFSSKTDESVLGANDGTITVTGSTSFVGGFVLSKDNGATYPFTGTSPYVFTGLAPATYNIKARNANGTCTTSIAPVVISAGAGVCDLTISFSSKTDETSAGANDGTITITGSTSHVGGFVLSKDNGATFPFTGTSPYTFTGLAPATYNIKARNSNGSCTTSIAAVVISAATPSLFLTIENDTSAGSGCTITGVDLGSEGYLCEIVGGGSETSVPVDYTTTPINVTCYLTFSALTTKAFYYAKFYKNGTLLGTRSFDKASAGGGFTDITYTGVSVVVNDTIKIEVTFQPYSELGTYIAGSGSSSSGVACALTMGDTVIFSSSPDGTLEVGDIALQYYDDGGVGYLVPVSEVSPAPNNFISYLIGATRYWASVNTTTGEVLTKGVCSAPPPTCDLELFYVGKTNESSVGANDGTITVSVATSFAGGWELSKDNGATYPISGSGSSPYTFTGLAPASYLIKARNVDDTCVDALASITISSWVITYLEVPCGFYRPEIAGSCIYDSCGRSMFTTESIADFQVGDTVYAYESGSYVLWSSLGAPSNTWMTYYYLGVKRSILMDRITSLVTSKVIC